VQQPVNSASDKISRNGPSRPAGPALPATELEQAIRRYVDLYDFAPVAYVSFDRTGRIEETNLAATKLLGRTRNLLIGCPFTLFVAREDSQLFLNHLLRCRSLERQVQTELRLKSAKRKIIFAHLSSTPITPARRDGTLLYQTAIVDLTERKRSEDALRRSEARYRTLFDLVPVAVYTCDAEGVIQAFNRRAVELWGRTPQGHNGDEEKFCGSFKMYYPDGRPMPHEECPMARALRGEQLRAKDLEIVVEQIDGKRRNVIVAPRTLTNDDGEIIGAINCVYDVTEHKRAEEQQEALYRFGQRQSVAKSSGDIYDAALAAILSSLRCNRASILLFDRRGVMRFVAWRGLSPRYRKAIEGHSPWRPDAEDPQPICIRDVDLAELPKSLQATIRAEGIRAAAFIPLVAKGQLIGKFMAYYNQPHIFDDDDISLGLNIARQLTVALERKRAEEGLQRSKLLLEQRVQQRTEALRAANRELHREIDLRKGLEGEILDVSDREQQRLGQELHDGLCQQLTAIGFMARATAVRVRDHRVVQVEDLEKIAQLINSSVTDARDIARDLHKEEVDAAGFVQALRDLVEREMWKTRCRLEMKTEPNIESDRTASQLYRILREALLNARKHAQASSIVVEVRRMKNDLVFSVIDNGVGFSTKIKNGHGLGFHIMQYRARSIGARLKLESPLSGGARVSCYLPQPNGKR
jgi:PAS domain S-box-containing protein